MNNNEHGRISKSTSSQIFHPDASIENGRYWVDQDVQHWWRKTCLELKLGKKQREIAGIARDTISLKYIEADHALEIAFKDLSFVLKPDGEEAAPGWLSEYYVLVEKERKVYWRPKEGVMRPEPIVKLVKRPGHKSKQKTGCVRFELDIEASPEYSRGFFLAAQDGRQSLVKAFLVELCKFTFIVIHEETGGMLVLAVPMHAKPQALHVQPSWTGWTSPVPSPDGISKRLACKKVGGPGHSNRLSSLLHRTLLGALAQHKMGLPLDALTGRCDAAGGIARAIERKSHVNRPLDLRVRERLDAWIADKLKTPEFSPLAPYMEQSKAIYIARKEEQLALIRELSDSDGASAESRAKAAADRKLLDEEKKAKEKLEMELSLAVRARATEASLRLAAEERLAAIDAKNDELNRKLDESRAARSAADIAFQRSQAESTAAVTAAERRHAAEVEETRVLASKISRMEASFAEFEFANALSLRSEIEARQALEAELTTYHVELNSLKQERATNEEIQDALLDRLIAEVRAEVPHPETGARPFLRLAVSTALTLLPKDLFIFEDLTRAFSTTPMDPALATYAAYVGTPEAKDYIGWVEAADSLTNSMGVSSGTGLYRGQNSGGPITR